MVTRAPADPGRPAVHVVNARRLEDLTQTRSAVQLSDNEHSEAPLWAESY